MTSMGSWFRQTPESLRLAAEETALLEASEIVAECLEERQMSRSKLADRLGIGRSEVTQRLNGRRNLTVRTLGAMLHELGYELHFGKRDLVSERTSRRIELVEGQGGTAPGARYTNSGNVLHVVRPDIAS